MKYSKEVMKRFSDPKYMGEIKDADGKGKVGNPKCGDIMEVYIKVEKDKIKDIKVKTFGCVAAIASSDVLCELAKGKTLKEAEKITKNDVLKKMGKVPPIKVHCSLLAVDALHKAIKDYKEGKNEN